MKTFIKACVVTIFMCSITSVRAQSVSEKGFSEIDTLIETLYDVISGPAGKRDWSLFKSLFYKNAIMGAVALNENGSRNFNSFTIEQYIDRSGSFFEENGFFEEEIGREVKKYGGIAQVFTAYQFKLKEKGEIAQRGINCIQLIYDKNRWYITNIVWEPESKNNLIPEALISN